MSLRGWQAALLKILPDPKQAPRVLAEEAGRLTQEESAHLADLSLSAGLEVTRDVQIWWRQARLQIAAPFSMRLIQRLDLQHLVAHYQKHPCTTLFFLREAQAFSGFIQDIPDAPKILRDMVQFECALHQAKLRQSSNAPATGLPGQSHTTELCLSYCPEACIEALLHNTPLPQPRQDPVVIQINSTWPRLWRTKVEISTLNSRP